MKVADGFDAAIIGYAHVSHLGKTVAVYSADGCIEVLMDRDGMTREDAIDHIEFNMIAAYVGMDTPLFVWEADREELELLAEPHWGEA